MTRVTIALILCLTALVGCGHSEQQQQAKDYEQFLKNSLGTVGRDIPAPPAH